MTITTPISDEKFELTICDLAGSGTYYADIADELRARDTAQHAALARVEAERDTAIVQMQNIRKQRDAINKELGDTEFNLCIAQQQLAEAVVLLKEAGAYFGWVPVPSLVGDIADFLARHAQAEQQEAPQGWAPCSPDLLKSGVCCESAPRIAGRPGSGVSHYHPAPQQEAQGAAEVSRG